MVVMIAMFISTGILSRMTGLHRAGRFLDGQVQRQLAARSASAVVLHSLNDAGSLANLPAAIEGEVEGVPYQARVLVDPEHPDVFHLVAEVEGGRYTRVLRQEPRRNTMAYSRVVVTGGTEEFLANDLTQGNWQPLTSPPLVATTRHGPVSYPAEAWFTFGTAANRDGDYFVGRQVGLREGGYPEGIALLRHRQGEGWVELPLADGWADSYAGPALNSIEAPSPVYHGEAAMTADETNLYLVERSTNGNNFERVGRAQPRV